MDLAHEAHYRTAWLVNQDMLISLSVGVTPDRLESTGSAGALDEQLLPALRRELARSGTARFIGLHITGSHWEYAHRYPSHFQRFGSAHELSTSSLFSPSQSRETRDAYDNSTLYTDWFLEQVIESVRKLPVPATVTFMPITVRICSCWMAIRVMLGRLHAARLRNSGLRLGLTKCTGESTRRSWKPCARMRLSKSAVMTFSIPWRTSWGISWRGAHPAESFASSAFEPDTATPYIAGGKLVRSPQERQ